MTRPIIGKMKTIVIPYCTQSGISLEEYEKITGVDLKEALLFDLQLAEGVGTIYVDPKPLAITLLECGDPEFALGGALLPISIKDVVSHWGSGLGDAETRIGCVLFDSSGEVSGGYFISLTISGNEDFSLENVTVSFGEL